MSKRVADGAVLMIALLLTGTFGIWYTSHEIFDNESHNAVEPSENNIIVTDSNGVEHVFAESPTRVAITNTYAATVMRMLEVDSGVIVGVSGDFDDENIWPEYMGLPMVQYSAHSEIDFESLLDTRPQVYIVFATNGMVDTGAIRALLEPVGISVLALDFYKYDYLRDEIHVLATLFGKQEQALSIFQEFDEIENMVHQRISNLSQESRPQIVMEHHASLTRDPVVLTGTSQWTDVIEKAGGVNVFASLSGHTTHVSMEAIIGANPDILMFDGITFDIGFNHYDSDNKCRNHMDLIADRDGFDDVSAIVEDKMIIMSGEFAGPMMIHGLPTLAKYFHPDLFEDVDTEQILDDYFLQYHGVERIGTFVCDSKVV